MAHLDILIDQVLGVAESRPEKIFDRLLFPGSNGIDLSYGLLIEPASRFSGLYRSEGIKKNDIVFLMLPPGPEILCACVGAWLRGALPSIFSYPSIQIPIEELQKTLPLVLEPTGAGSEPT